MCGSFMSMTTLTTFPRILNRVIHIPPLLLPPPKRLPPVFAPPNPVPVFEPNPEKNEDDALDLVCRPRSLDTHGLLKRL